MQPKVDIPKEALRIEIKYQENSYTTRRYILDLSARIEYLYVNINNSSSSAQPLNIMLISKGLWFANPH